MADSIFKQIGSIVGSAVSSLDSRVSLVEDEMTALNAGTIITEVDGDGVINASILPGSDVTYDLGSPNKMWKDIYVGPGSLYVNGQKVLQDDAGTITVSADLNQNVQIKTSGSGDIEFYPSGTGVLQMKGTVSLLSGTNLTTSDGQPISCPVGFSDLTIQNLTVTGTTTTVNTENVTIADNILTLNSNVTGTPTENAGIEVERGDENNAKILFNESLNEWQFSNDGSTYITFGNVDDHNHSVSDVSGLQAALDGKVDDSQVLTNVPAGAVFTDTVYSHPTTHSIAEVSGLQTALDGKVDDSQVLTDVPENAVFTDTVYSHPATHSIAEVSGLQSALDGKVDDSQVLTDVPENAVFTDTVYSHPATHSIAEVSGLQTALDGKLASNGNAVSASKLETARTIQLIGDATGSASFDGSGNISIDTTVTGGGAATLNELTDVDLTTKAPQLNDYLRYDGTKWVSETGTPVGVQQVLTPGITFPTIGSTINIESLIITTTVFQSINNDIHESTDWQIATDSGFSNIVFESLNDSTNKESINLTDSNLVMDTIYYIRVKHNGVYDTDEAWSSIINFEITISDGEQVYSTPGTYYWECPDGVSSVSVVCVGAGGSGWADDGYYTKGAGGGGLGWKNNISVTSGQLYTVVVGAGGPKPTILSSTNCGNGPGGDSYFLNETTVKGGGGGAGIKNESQAPGGLGGIYVGDGGGNGGYGGANHNYAGGGGGAGGYSGVGGNALYNTTNDYLVDYAIGGNGFGGGGGAGGHSTASSTTAGSGGGVGLFGQGTNGVGGLSGSNDDGCGGSGGSSGTDAAFAGITAGDFYTINNLNTPGLYGGGSGASRNYNNVLVAPGASGAVRIIWGSGRSFPNNAA